MARAVLQSAAEHLAQQLTSSRSSLSGELRSPLSQLSGIPYFPLSRRSFLGAPSLQLKPQAVRPLSFLEQSYEASVHSWVDRGPARGAVSVQLYLMKGARVQGFHGGLWGFSLL